MAAFLGNCFCDGNHFCASLVEDRLHVTPKYELDKTTQYWVIAIFLLNTLRDLVTLTFELLTSELCHAMKVRWSTSTPSLKWIWLTVPELRQQQFSINRQLKNPFFYVLGSKRVKFYTSSFFLNPKMHFLGRNDLLFVGMCPKMRPVGVMKKGKKTDKNFTRQTVYIPRPPKTT